MALLFVDDDDTGRKVSVFNLRRAGHDVDEARDGREALKCFDAARHELVVTDLRMPEIDGLQLLRHIHERAPSVPVVVITAFGNVDVAVSAMQAGAWSFIEKPFSRERLELAVQRALETSRLRTENRRLRGVERDIVAGSEAMKKVLALSDRLAPSDAPVLITGESGTGKELVARRVHARSKRSSGPFVAVNCAAIPANLVSAELFGHEKGAFTGATRARPGRFRSAESGSIFLDEVGELPLEAQGQLLRVLQEAQVQVVGADRPVAIDVRVIAATNRDLAVEVEERRFREDLYFRLDVLRVDVPPLRERTEDIPLLADHFLAERAERPLRLSEDALTQLKARRWRGNVRELRNVCERLALLSDGPVIMAEELPSGRIEPRATGWLDQLPEGLSLFDVEVQVIVHTLRRCGGNVSQAARILKVPRHILAYRIEKHGIEL